MPYPMSATRGGLGQGGAAWYRDGSALGNSVVAYWPLSEASGNRADLVGANTLVDNGVGSAKGLLHARAAEFVRSASKYLTIADNSVLKMGDVSFWVAGAFQLVATNLDGNIISKWTGTANNREWVAYFDNSITKMSFYVSKVGNSTDHVDFATALVAKRWYLLFLWHDAANDLFGIQINNGTPVTKAIVGGTLQSTAPFQIGAANSGGFAGMRAGDFYVGKNYALTAGDITRLISVLGGVPTANVAIWSRQGTVLSATVSSEDGNVYEPVVIYEGNAQLLSGNVFKMWYSGEWETANINYAESADGITWTKYSSNPVITNHMRSWVFKSSGTYYCYCANAANTQIDLYTSSNGVAWSLDTSSVIALGAGGAWDDNSIANSVVWIEGATWYMIYEAKRAATLWKLGLATSSDGRAWTKSGSNPVISATGSLGGPFIYKANDGRYWLWTHASPSGVLPTDLVRYYSTDLITWTPTPQGNVYVRVSADEGVGGSVGQIADPVYVERNGQVYMWHSASSDGGTKAAGQHIKLAIYPGTFEDLILSDEDYGT